MAPFNGWGSTASRLEPLRVARATSLILLKLQSIYINKHGYACLKNSYVFKICTEQMYTSWLESPVGKL